MRIMFTITALGEEAVKATKVKEKLEAVMKEFELEGNTNGESLDTRANYTGMYGKTAEVPFVTTPVPVKKTTTAPYKK